MNHNKKPFYNDPVNYVLVALGLTAATLLGKVLLPSRTLTHYKTLDGHHQVTKIEIWEGYRSIFQTRMLFMPGLYNGEGTPAHYIEVKLKSGGDYGLLFTWPSGVATVHASGGYVEPHNHQGNFRFHKWGYDGKYGQMEDGQKAAGSCCGGIDFKKAGPDPSNWIKLRECCIYIYNGRGVF